MRYGRRQRSPGGFSWHHGLGPIAFGLPRQLSFASRVLANPTSLDAVAPSPRQACLDASLVRSTLPQRYGNVDPLSIAYGYYALGLGPTNPTRIHLASETLGFRRTRFSRALTLLIPAFALLVAPADLAVSPSSPQNAPLPKASQANLRPLATASVASLSPDKLSAQDHSTSELLRTLSRMAASKPTSWLSE